MRALYFDGKLSVRDVEPPRCGPDEALIKVSLAGICGTDLQILKGYSGFKGILGHEFVGQVVECGDARWVEKRVVGEINVTCRTCEWCRRGLGRHCTNRTVMGIVNRPGAFAEFVTLPTVNLHEVPDEVSDESAVFVEPLAAAAEILEQVPIGATTSVAVLGSGRLGLLVAQVLRHAGAQVVIIGRNAMKLELARTWGFECRRAEESSAGDTLLPPKSFSVVVEATGSAAGFQRALHLVEPRGTIVLKSTFSAMAQFDTAKVVVDEITLIGSRCGNFVTALDLLRGGLIQLSPMISATFPLREAVKAFEHLHRPECLKVLLAPAA